MQTVLKMDQQGWFLTIGDLHIQVGYKKNNVLHSWLKELVVGCGEVTVASGMRVGLGSGKGIKHSEEEGRGEERKPLSTVGYPMPVKFVEVQRLGKWLQVF